MGSLPEENTSNRIPIIDLGPLLQSPDSSEELSKLAEKLKANYEGIGFTYLINHGFDLEALQKLALKFHSLPQEEKDKIKLSSAHRGYIPHNISTLASSELDKVTKPNYSDSFIIQRESTPDEVHSLAGPNQWPEHLPGFSSDLLEWSDKLTVLGKLIMAAFGIALGNPVEINKAFERPNFFLRLVRYPAPGEGADADRLMVAKPHSDYGCITFIAQDDVGGLQVLDKKTGEWFEAPPIKGAMVLNSGQLLHRWSNGTFSATPHRVVLQPGSPTRYSNVFFCDPNIGTIIKPFVEPALFPPVEYEEHMNYHRRSNYKYDK